MTASAAQISVNIICKSSACKKLFISRGAKELSGHLFNHYLGTFLFEVSSNCVNDKTLSQLNA